MPTRRSCRGSHRPHGRPRSWVQVPSAASSAPDPRWYSSPCSSCCTGPAIAVPMMGIAAVFGNLARVMALWRRVFVGVPSSPMQCPVLLPPSLGAHALLTISTADRRRLSRRVLPRDDPRAQGGGARQWRIRLWHLGDRRGGRRVPDRPGPVDGPLSVPIFTGFGLGGGAFLGPRPPARCCSTPPRLITFGQFGILTTDLVVRGWSSAPPSWSGPSSPADWCSGCSATRVRAPHRSGVGGGSRRDVHRHRFGGLNSGQRGFFSPASTATANLFSAGATGQVAKSVNEHGRFAARLKSSVTAPRRRGRFGDRQ